jgi:hypothetical protein
MCEAHASVYTRLTDSDAGSSTDVSTTDAYNPVATSSRTCTAIAHIRPTDALSHSATTALVHQL